MRAQDGGVSGQVVKVVHDDSDKQVQHLKTHTMSHITDQSCHSSQSCLMMTVTNQFNIWKHTPCHKACSGNQSCQCGLQKRGKRRRTNKWRWWSRLTKKEQEKTKTQKEDKVDSPRKNWGRQSRLAKKRHPPTPPILKKTKQTHQERTEEEKEDKVEVGDVQATAGLWRSSHVGVLAYGLRVTRLTTQTVQHDLLPRLSRRTPGQFNSTGFNHHSTWTPPEVHTQGT